jgi:F-type H+-transporting ATPase subunit b
MVFDASFWLAVSIILFFVLVFKQLKNAGNNILSTRINAITNKFNEIEAITNEAKNLLHEYKNLKKSGSPKAQEIINQTEQDIKDLKSKAKEDLAQKLKYKTEIMQNKVSNLEAQALLNLRIKTLDLAVASSTSLLNKGDFEYKNLETSLEEIIKYV